MGEKSSRGGSTITQQLVNNYIPDLRRVKTKIFYSERLFYW
ncbi:MAG: transglycosylase domain-containing protein [Saprospiraceae bacterium]|nr:transglycosylase domain-containing protein [Saprospiraceae bacterium]